LEEAGEDCRPWSFSFVSSNVQTHEHFEIGDGVVEFVGTVTGFIFAGHPALVVVPSTLAAHPLEDGIDLATIETDRVPIRHDSYSCFYSESEYPGEGSNLSVAA
jgi:hypothetical protein